MGEFAQDFVHNFPGKKSFVRRAYFSRAKLYKNADVSFFIFLCMWAPIRRPCSQASLAKTVETGDKNRDNFHSMQMSLVMSLRLIFGDD